MNEDDLGSQFAKLFLQLDGSPTAQPPAVTHACIAALFDRMVNPPESDPGLPRTSHDVDQAVQALANLIEEEAERVRCGLRRARKRTTA